MGFLAKMATSLARYRVREVVAAVHDDVVLIEDLTRVLAAQHDVVLDDADVAVERGQRDLCRRGLEHSDPVLGVEDLALQVAPVDGVEVDKADRADAGCREIEGSRTAEPAGSDEQHPGVEELALTLSADLGDEQMAAVALLLLRREHPGNDEVEASLLPRPVAAGHRLHVGVAQLLQRACCEQRANAGCAVQGDRRVVPGNRVLDAGFDEPLAEMHRSGDVPLVELGALAYVNEGAGACSGTNLLRGNLDDGASRFVEEVAGRLGHAASLPKTCRNLT